eukprot:Nk52_evm2s2496 gene=Nk52_evmTU2s2496
MFHRKNGTEKKSKGASVSARRLTHGVCGLLKINVVSAQNIAHGKHLLSALVGLFFAPYLIYYLCSYDPLDTWPVLQYSLLILSCVCIFQFFNGLRKSGVFNGLMWDSSFVVVSYGWNTYRTKETPTRQLPVWNECLPVVIKEESVDFSLQFSVYGKKLLSTNRLLGSCKVSLSDIIDLYKRQNGSSDEASDMCGLNDLDDVIANHSKPSNHGSPTVAGSPVQNSEHIKNLANESMQRKGQEGAMRAKRSSIVATSGYQEYEVTSSILHPSRKLNVEPGDMWIPLHNEDDHELDSTGIPELNIQISFVSAEKLQKRFWFWIFEQFDTNGDGEINQMEMGALFEAIGSDVNDESLTKLFEANDNLSFECAYKLITENDDWEVRDSGSVTDDKLSKGSSRMTKAGSLIFRTCPICKESLPFDHGEIILHLAVCTEGNSAIADKFVLGGFVTEANASRGWLTRLSKYITLGKYRLGSVSGNILVQNRVTGEVIEEKMPGFVRLGMRVLFQTFAGGATVRRRRIQRLMKHLTVKQGEKFDSPESVSSIIPFVHFHNINLKEIEVASVQEFRTFNEFFYRKLKPGARVLASPDPKNAICPADCRCVVYPSVERCTEFWVKGTNFSLETLVGNKDLAEKFIGGSIGIFRLAPQDYHRFHVPVNCTYDSVKHIEGSYYTVNPMAVREDINVFTENVRTICTFESPEFGTVVYACIGAMMVGSIQLTQVIGANMKRMDEFGYFAFGGSTIITLFQKNSIKFDNDLLENSARSIETLVQVGMSLGERTASLEKGELVQE